MERDVGGNLLAALQRTHCGEVNKAEALSIGLNRRQKKWFYANPAKQPGAVGCFLAIERRVGRRYRLRAGVRGQHVSVHQAKREKTEQREKNEDEGSGASLDEQWIFGGVRLGDLPSPAVEAGPDGKGNCSQQDYQEDGHR